MKKPYINIDQLVATEIGERLPGAPDKYRGAAIAPISALLGAERLGYNLS